MKRVCKVASGQLLRTPRRKLFVYSFKLQTKTATSCDCDRVQCLVLFNCLVLQNYLARLAWIIKSDI